MREIRIGRFTWESPVPPEVARRLMRILPLAKEQEMVEVPEEERPLDETLDLRCYAY